MRVLYDLNDSPVSESRLTSSVSGPRLFDDENGFRAVAGAEPVSELRLQLEGVPGLEGKLAL